MRKTLLSARERPAITAKTAWKHPVYIRPLPVCGGGEGAAANYCTEEPDCPLGDPPTPGSGNKGIKGVERVAVTHRCPARSQPTRAIGPHRRKSRGHRYGGRLARHPDSAPPRHLPGGYLHVEQDPPDFYPLG